jgi:hypothetical protein
MPREQEPCRYMPTGVQGEDQIGRAAPTGQVRKRPLIGSQYLGARLTVGRPAYPGGNVGPNPTPRTRIVGPTRRQPCRSRSATPGLGPEVVTISANIVASGLSLNLSDWARHEYPSPRQAN